MQGLIKPDRMDFIIQKATELGVSRIIAAHFDFSSVKLSGERVGTKLAHWQRVSASACEQSGRHRRPVIEHAASLAEGLAHREAVETVIVFHNDNADPTEPPDDVTGAVTLVVGPEGGLSPAELGWLSAQDNTDFASLGPRVLRAETAALAACTLAQARWGDLN